MKTKLQSMGFTASHAHLLLVAFALFSVLMVVKSDLSIKAIFVKADENVKMVTYDEVRAQIIAERGGEVTQESDAEAEAQLALLDRSLDEGKVLGESIGIGAIPNADNIFAREQLDTIAVTTELTSQVSVKKYSEAILGVESKHDAITLMSNLNSSDPLVLSSTKEQATVIIQSLKGLTVPDELADFHRYKMMYYQTLSNMADAFATNTLDANFQNTSKILFSIMEKMEQVKSSIANKYNVSL